MSGANCSRSSTPEYLNRNAPPVNAELPPRASFGAVSIIATLAPASCADSAALAAALPAPITRTSILPSSAGVMHHLPFEANLAHSPAALKGGGLTSHPGKAGYAAFEHGSETHGRQRADDHRPGPQAHAGDGDAGHRHAEPGAGRRSD